MNLTELSELVKKYLPYTILGFIILLIFFYIFKIVFLYTSLANKQPQTTINPIFEKISRPKVKKTGLKGKYKYSLDTIEGEPVTATKAANVYLLPKDVTRFGYREKVYLIAKNFGFDTEIDKYLLKGKEAVFENENQKLSVDITNYNYYFKYKLSSNTLLFNQVVIPLKNNIEEKAREFLSSVGRYPQGLAQGRVNISYLYYDQNNQEFTEANDDPRANAVRIDFYRADINDFPIVTSEYFKSQNYVIMIFYENDYKVLESQVRFFEKSDNQVGIYPLKTGEAVWKELTSGKGIFIKTPDKTRKIIIKKMFLGYLDPDIYQEYLQPVYVFLGDDFVGYVPAVSNKYLN